MSEPGFEGLRGAGVAVKTKGEPPLEGDPPCEGGVVASGGLAV